MRDEVFIRSFPMPGERTRVSQGGGRFPFWSPEGDRVYYWAREGGVQAGSPETLWAARVSRDPTAVLTRDSLFTGSYNVSTLDLHPDRGRLIVAQNVGVNTSADSAASEAERFLVVTNWFEELRARVGN